MEIRRAILRNNCPRCNSSSIMYDKNVCSNVCRKCGKHW